MRSDWYLGTREHSAIDDPLEIEEDGSVAYGGAIDGIDPPAFYPTCS
jgi:hypothetical protein